MTLASGPYKVMVVDDSAVIRGLSLARQDVEVVVLDIEMPVMDGLTALPLLLRAKPGIQVIMASTLTRKNADISMRAIGMGAADYIPKPTSRSELTGADSFRRAEKARWPGGHGPRRQATQPDHVVLWRGQAENHPAGAEPFSAPGAGDRKLNRWTAGAVQGVG